HFSENDKFLDKVFISLTHSTLITVIIVHLLVFLKLYETISLLALYFFCYLFYSWLRGKSPSAIADAMGMKLVISLLDMSEGKSGFKKGIANQAKDYFIGTIDKAKLFLKESLTKPFQGILLLAVIIAAGVIRFQHSILHSYYGASDPYVHLAWTKYLGANQIYRDGIYAQGYHAVISALNKITFIDPYFIVRFIGPIAGILLVVSIYYFASRNFSQYAAFISVAVFGLITDSRFPSIVWRQISALSQEYSAIFLLPGLHFFNLYITRKSNIYLLLTAECFAITLLIHPYISVFMIMGYFAIYLSYPRELINIKFSVKTFFALLAAFVLGLLPMGIGLGMGLSFFQDGYKYVTGTMRAPVYGNYLERISSVLAQENFYLIILLASAGVLFLISMVKIWNKDSSRIYLSMAFIVIVSYLLFKADKFGLPVAVDPWRAGIFTGLAAGIAYGASLDFVDLLIKDNKLLKVVKGLIASMALIAILAVAPINIPKGDIYEYDEAVNSYLSIKNSFPILNWTIIAPNEQYQQCLGFGWHYNLVDFAKKIPQEGKPSTDEDFTIPTDNIFIFVEKIPLYSKVPVNDNDTKKTIPELVGSPTDFYYLNPENRRIIQGKVYYWAEDYLKKNSNMKVYYEDEHMKIYFIKQDRKKPVKMFSV
ncbi:MAG: hypothetical protein HGA27_05730, partial [Peptococcaceae bacterium]|nr:hypothetical protein [Peptococcaceae bacterium]